MSRRRDDYETSMAFRFLQWLNGESDTLSRNMEAREAIVRPEETFEAEAAQKKAYGEELSRLSAENADKRAVLRARGIRYFQRFYKVMSVILCIGIILVLLWTVAALPPTGGADNPANNEVKLSGGLFAEG